MRSTALSRLAGLEQGAVTISGGFWARRQRTNRLVSLPLGRDRLEEAGNLENFREAARGDRHMQARGLPVFDSDVYKWLEAVGWELGRRPWPRSPGGESPRAER